MDALSSVLLSSVCLWWSNSFNLLAVFQRQRERHARDGCLAAPSSCALAGLARFLRVCECEYQPGIWRVACLISVCVGSRFSRMLKSPNTTFVCVCVRFRMCYVVKFGSLREGLGRIGSHFCEIWGRDYGSPLLGCMWWIWMCVCTWPSNGQPAILHYVNNPINVIYLFPSKCFATTFIVMFIAIVMG